MLNRNRPPKQPGAALIERVGKKAALAAKTQFPAKGTMHRYPLPHSLTRRSLKGDEENLGIQ